MNAPSRYLAVAGDEAGDAFERAARCSLKQESPHDTATSYTEAANCYKKCDMQSARALPRPCPDSCPAVDLHVLHAHLGCPVPLSLFCFVFRRWPWLRQCHPARRAHRQMHTRAQAGRQTCRQVLQRLCDLLSFLRPSTCAEALRCYKEVVSLHIDLGRFTQAAKTQKEIGELLEAEGDSLAAIDEYQKSVDYYEAEESNSQANQVLLKMAGRASNELEPAPLASSDDPPLLLPAPRCKLTTLARRLRAAGWGLISLQSQQPRECERAIVLAYPATHLLTDLIGSLSNGARIREVDQHLRARCHCVGR